MATPKHIIRKSKQLSKSDLTGKIINYFKENPTKVVNYKQILAALNLQKSNLRDVAITILDNLEQAGKIQEVQYGKYRANMRMGHVTGVIDRQTVAKKTYLIPDDGGENILIAERSIGCALNGDHVEVQLFPRRKGREQEGEVIAVLERKKNEFVGILEVKEYFAFLCVDKKLLPKDIFIPKEKLNGGKNGQRCIGKILNWTDKDKNPDNKADLSSDEIKKLVKEAQEAADKAKKASEAAAKAAANGDVKVAREKASEARNAEEEAQLYQRILQIVDNYGVDFVVVTTKENEFSSSAAYADSFYRYNNFGKGTGKAAIVFLIDMKSALQLMKGGN